MKKGLIYQKYTLTGRSNINSNTPSAKPKLTKTTFLRFRPGYNVVDETVYPVTDDDLQILTQLDTSEVLDIMEMFDNCEEITTIPLFDTHNVQSFGYFVGGCPNLENFPLFDTTNARILDTMIDSSSCDNLTDESLYNIVQMCINAVNLLDTQPKILQNVVQASGGRLSDCMLFDNYQAFLDAGWTLYNR